MGQWALGAEESAAQSGGWNVFGGHRGHRVLIITGKGSVAVLLRARLRPRGAAFPGLTRAVPLMVACLASQTPVALYKSQKRSSGCDVCHQSV